MRRSRMLKRRRQHRRQHKLNSEGRAGHSNQVRVVEKEDESAGDASQQGRGAEAESDRRHRDANPAATRSDRHHHHGRRRSANPGAEDPARRRRAARGARRAGHAERLARLGHRRVDSRRDAVADADHDRWGRGQRWRDRQLRHRQSDRPTISIGSRFCAAPADRSTVRRRSAAWSTCSRRRARAPPKASLLSEGGNRATSQQVGTVSGAEGNLGYSGALSYFSTEGFRPINDNSDNLALNGGSITTSATTL